MQKNAGAYSERFNPFKSEKYGARNGSYSGSRRGPREFLVSRHRSPKQNGAGTLVNTWNARTNGRKRGINARKWNTADRGRKREGRRRRGEKWSGLA